MTPYSVFTAYTDRNLDPLICRDHAQHLRSEYLSHLIRRAFRAARRRFVLLARQGLSRLHQP